jgi:ankyrin repeat protein
MGQAFGTAGAPGPDVLVLEASLGNVDNVKRILAYGELVDLNWATAKEKWTALHTAAKGGHLKVLQLLVDAGAFIHAVDAEGYCPVHLACAGGHEECVKYLVEKGAGFSFRNDGSWAIHDAAGHGHMGVVTYLVALSEGRCASLATATGKTPLHYATANGQIAAAQYLAEQPGVDKDAQTATGETPLFAAMGCPDKVRACVGHGTCVCSMCSCLLTLDLFQPTGQARTVAVVEYLLAIKANPSIANSNGWTALHRASMTDNVEAARLLLAANARLLLKVEKRRIRYFISVSPHPSVFFFFYCRTSRARRPPTWRRPRA